MEWTYSVYSGFNYGICIVLCIIIFIGVIVIFATSKKGKEFVTEEIIGVDPNKAEEDDDDEAEKTDTDKEQKKENERKQPNPPAKRSVTIISVFFCFFAIMSLSITAILIFQSCILMHTRLLPTDYCPEYPVDCFVFNGTSRQPISENVSFYCTPSNNTNFPKDMSDPTAMCFGWIIRLQTTENVLNQLGVCTGLLGLFTTLLTVVIYLGKTKKTIVLCLIFMFCCGAAIVLLIFFKWSFSALTFAVLVLGIALGVFGIVLYRILPKKTKSDHGGETTQPEKVDKDVPSVSNLSSSVPSVPPRPSTNRTKLIARSSKVTPK